MCITMSMINCIHREITLTQVIPEYDSDMNQNSGSSERGRCRRGRSEIPHFPSKLQSFAIVPGETKKSEENRRKAKKNEEKRKSEENRKKWENSSDPIYTNPIKNLPKNEPFQ